MKNLFLLSDLRVILLANCFIFVYNVQVYRNIVYTFDMMVKAFLPENQFQTTMEAYIRILRFAVFFCFGRQKRGNYVRKIIQIECEADFCENRGNCRYHNLSGNGLYSWGKPVYSA